jgi:hypothetical protein
MIHRGTLTYEQGGKMVEVHCYSDGLYNHKVVVIIPEVSIQEMSFVDWDLKRKNENNPR